MCNRGGVDNACDPFYELDIDSNMYDGDWNIGYS